MSRRLPVLLALAIALPLSAGEVRLQAPPAIAELLTPYLPEAAGNPRRLQAQLGEILATEGYFAPEFTLREPADGLQIEVAPGPRTLIGAVELTIDGPLAPGRLAELQAAWKLAVGEPFRQADWNDAKQQLLGELLADEHAAARLLDSRAEIDPVAGRARLLVHYDAGPRFRYGALRVEGLGRYDATLVERYNRLFQPGQPYREADLNKLQAVLQATPYFSSVQATLARDEAVPGADGTASAPVVVRVGENPPHRVAFGAGASSNTGARVEATYHTPDFAGQAWELDSGLRVEQKRQTAYADLFLPPDERNHRLGYGVSFERSDIQNLQIDRHALGAQLVQPRGAVEQRLALNWEQETRNADGAAPVSSRALVPSATWTWRQVDSLLAPRHGSVLQLQAGGGARALLSDQDFLRFYLRWQHYLPLGSQDTLALRGDFGRTFADSRQHIPQDYLFRSGGTGSVRGYGYQSLGLSEGNATVGGRQLAVLSVEATHWLDESWGIAAFVDAGDAADRPSDLRPALGYGLGARWRSPAGPLGADLAYGERTGKVQLHFSLAIPF